MPYKPFHTFNFSSVVAGALGLPGGATTGYGANKALNVLGGAGQVNSSVPAFSISGVAGITCSFLGPGSDDVNGRHGVTFNMGVGFHDIPIRRILDTGNDDCQITIYTQ